MNIEQPIPAVASRPVIAIIGRPNVGKSTLFNKLFGKRKAIVHDMPGVTRDRNQVTCSYRGRGFTLIDTGGLDLHSNEAIAFQAQSKKAVAEADILLFLMDAREGLTPADEEAYAFVRKSGKPLYLIINKTEGGGSRQLNDFYRLGATLYPISAEHNHGISDLLDTLYPHLVAEEEEAGETQYSASQQIPKVVVLGRPNVGKSTLINTLLREDRLVTSDMPGTTRDAIDTEVLYEGRRYLFIDTAGIRKKGKVVYGVEQYSVGRSKEALNRADIALLLLDGVEGVTEQDTKIAGMIVGANRGLILLVNKADILPEEKREALESQMDRYFPFLKFMKRLEINYISARTGEGVAPIFQKAQTIYERFHARISTGDLNRFFEKLIASHPPPATRAGKRTRLYYITQALTGPPTFILFSNTLEISDAYLQYIENRLREKFGFAGVPIRMKLREKSSRTGIS
ncbi:MAG: ribosome biogenesis GTPase Der [Nitrospirae bacterium]|nr:ribosome biogenesis GTPase Der [Candidatus Troglogloeales bacterium]MBI3598679.1 ribosome biogenesis GTPase Der [Candidatus Troglogloeales bacterium]